MLHIFKALGVRSRRLFTSARYPTLAITLRHVRPLALGTVLVFSASHAVHSTIHLDTELPVINSNDVSVDPATSIIFPATLRLPSKVPLPTFTLVGVGVRTVSFLGINVYSVGFYADLQNPKLKISECRTADQKIEHIVRNTACVLRIIPTRSTSYSHLRDGFMRSLQTRLLLGRQRGTLSTEEEQAVQSPLRKLKSIFPGTPLKKHTPLDILLSAPSSEPTQSRSLIIRDMGSVENDWVATEFILAYFEGDGPSPPLKKSVVDRLNSLYGKSEPPLERS